MSAYHINRRQFLNSAGATLAYSILGAAGLDIFYNPTSYRVGLIGTGWYGKNDLFRLVQVAPVEIVALCDVDQKVLADAANTAQQRQKSGKKPMLYKDYRKMLAEQELDIVLIGSPDHWHALQAIEAMKSGAHVYVQKPISVDVLEGEAMLAAARKYNRVVQVGTQRRSTPHLMEAKENILDKGLLGKIAHVEMCCYYHMRANDNWKPAPVPDFLDFDLWTGPAPMRTFSGLPHRRWWRAFEEYGNGIMGDMCIHMFDTVRWMLNLGWPKKISSTGGIYVQTGGQSNISDTQSAIFEYDDLNCIWQHRTWGAPADPEYPWAFMIYGEKGTLKASVFNYEFIPRDKNGTKKSAKALLEKEQYPEDATEANMEFHAAPATRRHLLNFLNAIENNEKPVADILEGHISSASCILANISAKVGRPVTYVPSQQKILGDKEANKWLARNYRKPWQHPWK